MSGDIHFDRMKTLIFASCLLAAAHASLYSVVPLTTQYHAQDNLGQYSYGYSGGPSSKAESRTLDGVTRGAYSYIDAYGIVQSVNYIADPLNGFRVAATNLPQAPRALPLGPYALSPLAIAPLAPISPVAPELSSEETVPQDTPEVVTARAAHLQAHAEARALHSRKRRSLLIPQVLSYAAPIVATNNYEVRGNLGQYSYGYNDGNSVKAESRSLDGTTNGGYSYLDGNGLVQSVQYTADTNGFRVAATNLPVARTLYTQYAPYTASLVPLTPFVAPASVPAPISSDAVLVAPEAPQDTPEVVAAKSAHFAAHAEARARLAQA